LSERLSNPGQSQLVSRYAQAQIPVRGGRVWAVVFREAGSPEGLAAREHLALVAGELPALAGEDVLARVHSECWTGETLGSLKCDCRDQLDQALDAILAAGRGVVVYLRQEGRGIGLGNKIRAYALQDRGADTVEANEQLGFAADLRSYELAGAILKDLGVHSVALMTNNPDKVNGIEGAGIKVVRRVPHWGEKTEFNSDYLEVKKLKLGHEH
jgi:GTP cyclohydrolase II